MLNCLFSKLGLAEQAIDVALQQNDYDLAFKTAEDYAPNKIKDIRCRFAMKLEEEGRFALAEKQFLQADKPREAIEMYFHQKSWEDALRIAQEIEPSFICLFVFFL